MLDASVLWVMNLMTATTVGAGLFALPYVFAQTGWLLSGAYLAVLAAAVAFVHGLYLEVVRNENEKPRLLTLIEKHYGRNARLGGLVIILGGLTLTLLAYLILSRVLIALFLPGYENAGLWAFWLLSSLPVLFRVRRLMWAEAAGGLGMLALILWVFGKGLASHAFHVPVWNWEYVFLPLGPVLFALAGWTAVEPSAEYARRAGLSLKEAGTGLRLGTLGAALLYALFVAGISGAGGAITPDTVQGLSGWLPLEAALVAVLGLFAVWTSYVPMGLEMKRISENDLGWSKLWSGILVFCLPPALFLLGLDDFLKVIGLVGGVFLAGEYIYILLVARRALRLPANRARLTLILVLLFALAAVYEVYYFIVQ